MTLTITSKGQVTLRKAVLAHLGVGPGEQVEVELRPRGQVVIHAKRAQGSMEDFIGLFGGTVAYPVSVEAMNEVIADGWAGGPDDQR